MTRIAPDMKYPKTRWQSRPEHWSHMETAICGRLLVGDILYGNLDDLFIDRLSSRRVVVARPSEERIFLLSTSMAPSDEEPSDVVETFITTGAQLERNEIGERWSWRERRIALQAAEDVVDGTIRHAWLSIWGEGRLHLVARVARSGLLDSLQTISVTRPAGSLFRKNSTAKLVAFRSMPKRFLASGTAEVYGGKETKGGVRIG